MNKLVACLLLLAGCSMQELAAQPSTVTDMDGNVYHTVTIGTQVWMVENLKTTRYNDSTTIPLVTDDAAWSSLVTDGFCWYNDSITYKEPYGALYNWWAVNTGKLAPRDWHIPTDAEWNIVTKYLGGDSLAGGKMKEAGTTYWHNPNTGADNSSGFSALPGGDRCYKSAHGVFKDIGEAGYWWSSSEYDALWARYRGLYSSYVGVEGNPKEGVAYANKGLGFSVRCVRDEMASDVDTKSSRLPNDFSLHQNYPNPFNSSTNISFSLPVGVFVSLKVFDLLGREVAVVLSEDLTAGSYTRKWNADGLSGGVYFYRLTTPNGSITKAMMVLD
jgi:uncharacterized protein (TIGR02145 family)